MTLKILLSSVGNRDPLAPDQTEGSIVTACRRIEPDILFLFPTAEQPLQNSSSTEENANKTKEFLQQILPKTKVYIRVLDIPDPTDYQQILKLMENEVLSVQEKFRNSLTEYHISISSGTPQMQACWLLLVNSGRIKAKAWQVLAPQWCQDDESRCRVIETGFIEEQNKINRAKEYFDLGIFKAAQDELELLALSTYMPDRATKAELFANLCAAYQDWDLYLHREAITKLEKLLKELRRFHGMNELVDILSEQLATLQEIVKANFEECQTNLLDLLHNAERRRKNGQYADCLARFSRIYEGCYYYLVKEYLKDVDPRKKLELQPEWVKQLVKNKGYLNVYDCHELMQYKEPDRAIPDGLFQDLNAFKNQRNNSIIAHGMEAIEKRDADQALKLTRKLFEHIFRKTDPDTYCFSLQSLARISEIMFKMI